IQSYPGLGQKKIPGVSVQTKGPECQGESAAKHLVHVLRSDRFSHRHTQQAAAWNCAGQLPWQRTAVAGDDSRRAVQLHHGRHQAVLPAGLPCADSRGHHNRSLRACCCSPNTQRASMARAIHRHHQTTTGGVFIFLRVTEGSGG
ncbi:hypothetical protein ILYODFUR_007614, partial [Ilyodon furcidens]